MIRLARCTQASKAGHYFRTHLATGDNQANPASPFAPLRAAWVGPALGDVNLAPFEQPTAAHLVRLGRGLHPVEKFRLAPAINRKRAYYDLTVATAKTVSLAALLNPNHPTARSVMQAHQNAVEAVSKAVGTMIEPRSGTGPARWLGAVFTHTHTREGDPHLHSHVILPNVTMNREGQWRAMQVNIAGINRTRLELIYGHELARQLQRRGLGPEIVMRSNGLPEFRSLRRLTPRYNRATAAVLAAAKAAEEERVAKDTSARKDEVELHRRSRLPVPPDRAQMRRRQRLADQLRKPKPKDADDPVRLSDEAARWMRSLTNLESRELSRLLDAADPTHPRRAARVVEKMPPSAANIVRAAYRMLPYDVKPTAPLLLRASVQRSAGRHEYEDLRVACNASMRARFEANQRLLVSLNAEADEIAAAEYEPITQPFVGPRFSPQPEAAAPVTAAPAPVPATPSTPAAPVARPGRGARR